MKFLFPLLILASTLSFAQEDKKEIDQKVEKKNKYLHQDLKPKKRHQGLIDPLIDNAKEASEEGKKKIEEVTGKILRSEDLRDDSFGTLAVGYQPFATWIPGKWSASYTQIFDRSWSLEGEYSKASLSIPVFKVDIGSIEEERATLHAHYYSGNSYHWTFGLVYSKAEANLGADIPTTANYNFFEMENIGATFGFGNRWLWESGISFGIDWFRMNQPLFARWENDAVVKDLSDNDATDVKKVMRGFNTLPTFVFLGIKLGYTF